MIALARNRLLNILLADDGSLDIHSAVQLLADLPQDGACKITALRAFTLFEGSEYSNVDAEAEKTKNLLKSHNLHFHSELVLGQPSETIIAYATKHSPDLIVIGARSTGLFRGLLGSVATDVIHSGQWPVLIVRQPYNGLKRVLLVTDGSPASHFTGEYLGAFPLPQQTSLEVMHVIPQVRTPYMVEPVGMVLPMLSSEDEARMRQENETQGNEILERTCHELSLHGLNAEKILRTGNVAEQILTYTKGNKVDLVVCGSRGAGNITGWLLGSVSRELVQHLTCSLMVVHNPYKSDENIKTT